MASMSTRGRNRKDQPNFDYARGENQDFNEMREERSNVSSGNEEPNSEVIYHFQKQFLALPQLSHM